ncbi:hypothetical protein GCM10009737_35310 [Nocardioides lentus]|uniref:PKD domain-containing protein n=1 Tax=Nocardioides lentus TaxID=338077 RepID=A0ABN2PSY7_9ACTN
MRWIAALFVIALTLTVCEPMGTASADPSGGVTAGGDYFDLAVTGTGAGGTSAPGSTAGGGPVSGASSGGGPVSYWIPTCAPILGLSTVSAADGCGGSGIPCGDGGTVGTTYTLAGGVHTNNGMGCIEPTEPGAVTTAAAAPVITPAMILSAFRRIPLPDSEIVVQPPGGETLVNFDTIFSTEAEEDTASVSLLGQLLEFEAFPSSYTWEHGDGSTQTTDHPGRAYAEGVAASRYVSHRYEDAQVTVEPSVDTTWSGRYRLNGGPWLPVAGTVTIEGDPSSLRVVEGQPNLVG